MENTFASRVKEYRLSKGLSQTAFAQQCGLEQGNITQMEKGTEPKQRNITKLMTGFPDLSPDWLLLGIGSMLRDGKALAPLTRVKDDPPVVSEMQPDYTSAASTYEEASALVKLAKVEATNEQLEIRLKDAQEEILWLRGKSSPSADAAGPGPTPPRPAPIQGFVFGVSQRIKARRSGRNLAR